MRPSLSKALVAWVDERNNEPRSSRTSIRVYLLSRGYPFVDITGRNQDILMEWVKNEVEDGNWAFLGETHLFFTFDEDAVKFRLTFSEHSA